MLIAIDFFFWLLFFHQLLLYPLSHNHPKNRVHGELSPTPMRLRLPCTLHTRKWTWKHSFVKHFSRSRSSFAFDYFSCLQAEYMSRVTIMDNNKESCLQVGAYVCCISIINHQRTFSSRQCHTKAQQNHALLCLLYFFVCSRKDDHVENFSAKS